MSDPKNLIEEARAPIPFTIPTRDAFERRERQRLALCDALEAAQKENERLRAWVNDLQAGMYINCVYCGHRYGPDDEIQSTMAEVLKEHIKQCPKHPLSAAESQVARLREALGKACKFHLDKAPDDPRAVWVEQTHWAPDSWAVRTLNYCLNKQGEWEFEPIPSSRDDAFKERCRWPSASSARMAYRRALSGPSRDAEVKE